MAASSSAASSAAAVTVDKRTWVQLLELIASLADLGQFDGEWKKKDRGTSCLKAGADSAMGARGDRAFSTQLPRAIWIGLESGMFCIQI